MHSETVEEGPGSNAIKFCFERMQVRLKLFQLMGAAGLGVLATTVLSGVRLLSTSFRKHTLISGRF